MSIVSESAPARDAGPAFKVPDAKGNSIRVGSVVGMPESYGPWSRYQGLVVSPYSELEGTGSTVAVFFNREVHSFEFRFHDPKNRWMDIDEWDREYLARCVKGDTDFLLDADEWMKCPRIRFFKPEELLVQRWKIESLSNRLFPNFCNSFYQLPFWGKFSPEEYMCWREGCHNPSEPDVALGNVNGTVYSLCLCKEHRSLIHGLCGDGLPKMKSSFFLRDGRIISARGVPAPLAA